MNWSQIITMQRAKVTNLFDRLVGCAPWRYGDLEAAYEQEHACLRAMGTLLIAGNY